MRRCSEHNPIAFATGSMTPFQKLFFWMHQAICKHCKRETQRQIRVVGLLRANLASQTASNRRSRTFSWKLGLASLAVLAVLVYLSVDSYQRTFNNRKPVFQTAGYEKTEPKMRRVD